MVGACARALFLLQTWAPPGTEVRAGLDFLGCCVPGPQRRVLGGVQAPLLGQGGGLQPLIPQSAPLCQGPCSRHLTPMSSYNQQPPRKVGATICLLFERRRPNEEPFSPPSIQTPSFQFLSNPEAAHQGTDSMNCHRHRLGKVRCVRWYLVKSTALAFDTDSA